QSACLLLFIAAHAEWRLVVNPSTRVAKSFQKKRRTMSTLSFSIDRPSYDNLVREVVRAENPVCEVAGERLRLPSAVRVAKRGIDIVMALLGLLVAALFVPFLMLAIRLDSRGPIF